MEIKSFYNLSKNEKESFYDFCKSLKTSKDDAASNMYSTEPNGLLYLLDNSNRFKHPKGQFNIVYDNNNIVCCGGIYLSDFSDEIAIAGVRTWVTKYYRNKAVLREYLLPHHKQWAILQKCRIIALTFNQYNKNIIEIFKRSRLGEKNDRIKSRESFHLFYNGLCEIPYPINIQHTKQWVIYELLDDKFIFDWGKLKD